MEDKLRNALQQNQQMIFRMEKMENTIRQIASEAQMAHTDIGKLDINELSTKLIEFMKTKGNVPDCPSPLFGAEAADSLLIDETFNEIDELERKYEDKEQLDFMDTPHPPKTCDDEEFEDDIPPKTVCW